MRLTILCGRHRSTIWKVLKRHGKSRRRRSERQTFRRFEWSQPGALLHIDAYKAPKFLEPGHRVTGDRDKNNRARNLGHTVVIAVQDDHTRLVYTELHGAGNAANVSITLRRATAWFVEQGCGPMQAVMSDNAKCYSRSHAFRDTLAELGAAHPDPALHAALEREDRALLRDARRRMGARPRLAQQHHPRPRPRLIHPILQPLQASQRRGRPTTPSPAFTKSAGRTTSRLTAHFGHAPRTSTPISPGPRN